MRGPLTQAVSTMSRRMVSVVLVTSVLWHTVAGCCAHHHHETSGRVASVGHARAFLPCSRDDAPRITRTLCRVAPLAADQGGADDLPSRASAAEDSFPAGLPGQGFRICREGSCSFAGAPTVRIKTAAEPRRPLHPAADAVCRCSLIGASRTVPEWGARGVLVRCCSDPFPGTPLRTHLVLCVLTL